MKDVDEETKGNEIIKVYIEKYAKLNDMVINNYETSKIDLYNIIHRFDVNKKEYQILFNSEDVHDCASHDQIQNMIERKVRDEIKRIKRSS